MKKALSLVLALVMVLSMAVVGFAADVAGTKYTATLSDTYTDKDGNYFVDLDIDVAKEVKKVAVTAKTATGDPIVDWIRPVNALELTYQIQIADATGIAPEAYSVKKFEAAFITITTYSDEAGTTILDQDTYKVTYTAPVEVQKEVKDALEAAVKAHSIEVVIDATKLADETLNAADFAYITNSYDDTWDWTAKYLGFEVTVINGTTVFDLGLVDYTWTKAIDFSFYTKGVVTDAQYNMIRTLTGDTKDPLVFGFDGDAVPAGTVVDMVIPQAWINYYGHKNLTLFAWTAPITATYDNGANAGTKITMEDAKVLAETALDVNTTVTQRIQFETDTLYKTLVLSANGLPAADGEAVEDNKDANPNTGANDIVNVAVVFAVVSLAAAGALVCKKSK